MKLVALNDGFFKIDDEDYEKCINIKWNIVKGYVKSNKYGLLHRYLLGADKENLPVDHINCDKLDNQKNNLRFVSVSQNNQNKIKKDKCSSKYIGVTYIKKNQNWICRINKKSKSFNDELHAAYWYDIQAVKYYGIDAKTNKIEIPLDFINPIDKIDKILPTGVYLSKEKYYTTSIGGEYLGIFKTINEAEEAYKKRKTEKENIKKNKLISKEIVRNESQSAIIITTKKEEIMVDDNKYHDLIRFSWYINPDGYASSNVNGKTTLMHRFITKANKGDIIDHIDKNRVNNQILNLRKSNESLNNHNKTKKSNASSQYYGVCLEKCGKYRSSISCNKIRYYIGSYVTEEDAAKAYDNKAIELYGIYANLNFP